MQRVSFPWRNGPRLFAAAVKSLIVVCGIWLVVTCTHLEAAQGAEAGAEASPPAESVASAPQGGAEPVQVDPFAGRRFLFPFHVGFSHQIETDLNNGGEFDVTRTEVGGGLVWVLNPQLKWDTSVQYRFSDYDFSGDRGLGGLNPWSDVHETRLISQLKYALNEQWTIHGGPILSLAAETGADLSDSFTGGGIAGFTYRASDTLQYGVALAVIDKIEEDAAVFPVVTLNWLFDDFWTLRTGVFPLGSSGGAGLEFAWDFAEDFEVSFGGQYQTHRFRLDDDGVNKDGVGEEKVVPLFAQLTYKPGPRLKLSGFLGLAIGGELRLENDRGHKITDKDYDATGVVGLRGGFVF